MTMSWLFSELDGGTQDKIVCDNAAPGIDKHDHLTGLRSSLGNLAAFIDLSVPKR
jgi:hypothetical protein